MKNFILILCLALSAFAGNVRPGYFYATRLYVGDSLGYHHNEYLITADSFLVDGWTFDYSVVGWHFITHCDAASYEWVIYYCPDYYHAVARCLNDPERGLSTPHYELCTWKVDTVQVERRVSRLANERPRHTGRYDILGRRLPSNPAAANRILGKHAIAIRGISK
jgi:hypothetical protein